VNGASGSAPANFACGSHGTRKSVAKYVRNFASKQALTVEARL